MAGLTNQVNIRHSDPGAPLWSCLGYVNDGDIKDVVAQPEVPGNQKEDQLTKGWMGQY